MKLNRTLTWLVLGYLVINVYLEGLANTGSVYGTGYYLYLLFLFWIAAFTGLGFLAYTQRQNWFYKEKILSTIILLPFCTPVPFVLFIKLCTNHQTFS